MVIVSHDVFFSGHQNNGDTDSWPARWDPEDLGLVERLDSQRRVVGGWNLALQLHMETHQNRWFELVQISASCQVQLKSWPSTAVACDEPTGYLPSVACDESTGYLILT